MTKRPKSIQMNQHKAKGSACFSRIVDHELTFWFYIHRVLATVKYSVVKVVFQFGQ